MQVDNQDHSIISITGFTDAIYQFQYDFLYRNTVSAI
jgi:hypothetical protein